MNIFLDTVDLAAVQKLRGTGLIDGITTNPSLLSTVTQDVVSVILALSKELSHGCISVEVTEKDPEKMYIQAKKIAALADNIVVKIPCFSDYYSIMYRLIQEGISLNITLVFTLVQGLMMAKLGVTFISPFVGRLDDIDGDGALLLSELRNMIDRYNYDTKILAASLRHMRHIHAAITAGADIVTVPVSLFERMMGHPLTDSGMIGFDKDWKKAHKKEFLE